MDQTSKPPNGTIHLLHDQDPSHSALSLSPIESDDGFVDAGQHGTRRRWADDAAPSPTRAGEPGPLPRWSDGSHSHSHSYPQIPMACPPPAKADHHHHHRHDPPPPPRARDDLRVLEKIVELKTEQLQTLQSRFMEHTANLLEQQKQTATRQDACDRLRGTVDELVKKLDAARKTLFDEEAKRLGAEFALKLCCESLANTRDQVDALKSDVENRREELRVERLGGSRGTSRVPSRAEGVYRGDAIKERVERVESLERSEHQRVDSLQVGEWKARVPEPLGSQSEDKTAPLAQIEAGAPPVRHPPQIPLADRKRARDDDPQWDRERERLRERERERERERDRDRDRERPAREPRRPIKSSAGSGAGGDFRTCNSWNRYGHCQFGANCWYSHEENFGGRAKSLQKGRKPSRHILSPSFPSPASTIASTHSLRQSGVAAGPNPPLLLLLPVASTALPPRGGGQGIKSASGMVTPPSSLGLVTIFMPGSLRQQGPETDMGGGLRGQGTPIHKVGNVEAWGRGQLGVGTGGGGEHKKGFANHSHLPLIPASSTPMEADLLSAPSF
ncbi:hypothetical protein BDK51DRAFT_46026 [Blyttiomyces helicus]|uniref:C3H1-type domain-containing protein n=1 Tax=Blyttiomyces helicus TaxID=388810 RepID=A0A4P9WFZ3_9FUNG|nr:hypothetical protein BDK51DRAFT_46026 [Blyttiomyces helicus]|eukprot:RKO90713.1 hypothetical protein BDK51DRAFT_46026 [Blyttiomyces helicus]